MSGDTVLHALSLCLALIAVVGAYSTSRFPRQTLRRMSALEERLAESETLIARLANSAKMQRVRRALPAEPDEPAGPSKPPANETPAEFRARVNREIAAGRINPHPRR